MRQVPAIATLNIFISLLVPGCRSSTEAPHQAAAQRQPSSPSTPPGSVEFLLKPLPPDGRGFERWQATYTADGRIASFRFELSPAVGIDPESDSFKIKTGKGRFFADAASDSTVLIANLKTALEAKRVPARVKRVQSLPFTYVAFEEHESLASDGGFSQNPRGNWVPMKIFLGSDKDDIEVYLNLDAVDGKAQFSIKDADYGDDAVRVLASVL